MTGICVGQKAANKNTGKRAGRYVLMRSIILLFVALYSSLLASEEWSPNWERVQVPGINSEVNLAIDNRRHFGASRVFWVYLTYMDPQVESDNVFWGELQEWFVDCESLKGSIATIRYSKYPAPGVYNDFKITHPGGGLAVTSEQIKTVCKRGT